MIVIVVAVDGPLCARAAPRPRGGCDEAPGSAASRSRRWAILHRCRRLPACCRCVAMARILDARRFRGERQPRCLASRSANNQNLVDSIIVTVLIAALTAVGMLLLLVPTMVWTYIRLAGHEAGGRIPLSAAARDPGRRPRRRDRADLLDPEPADTSAIALTLAFIDIILVLPYAHRAIDAGMKSIDVATLAEAARSLGGGWPRRDLPDHRPNIARRDPVRRRHLGRAGARRVHDLVPAELRHAAGRDQPARQARCLRRGRGVARRAAPRVPARPADRGPRRRAAAHGRGTARGGCSPHDRPRPQSGDRHPGRGHRAAPRSPPPLRPRPRPRRPDARDGPGRARRAARARPAAARPRRCGRWPGSTRRTAARSSSTAGTSPTSPRTSGTWAWCSRPTACSRT